MNINDALIFSVAAKMAEPTRTAARFCLSQVDAEKPMSPFEVYVYGIACAELAKQAMAVAAVKNPGQPTMTPDVEGPLQETIKEVVFKAYSVEARNEEPSAPTTTN